MKQYKKMLSKVKSLVRKEIRKGSQLYVEDFSVKNPLTDQRSYLIQLPNQKILNLELIKSGLFRPETKLLNGFWKRRFLKAYREAVSKKKGFWQVWKWQDEFPKKQKKSKLSYAKQKRVSIMTYNLENLFDAQKNSKRDDSYLPIQFKQSESHKEKCEKIKGKKYKKECLHLDWTESKYKEKIKRISQVILRSTKDNKGPDIILAQEIENYDVLKELKEQHLKHLNYEIYHMESPDFRGIDVSILSKLKLASLPRHHVIKYSRYRATRGILEATFFLPNGELLTTLVFHFPSQASKTKARAEALTFLDKLGNSFPSSRYVVAGGDCNIIKTEETELYSNYLKTWKVSHRVGCDECKGTYYFPPKKSWSFLDVFYYKSPDVPLSKWEIDASSIRIVNDIPLQNYEDNTPKAFHSKNDPGISDHWPLYMELELQQGRSNL